VGQGHLAQIVHDGGGSQDAVEFFQVMTDAQFDEWRPRYEEILAGLAEKLNPPMQRWEQEFADALANCKLRASKPIC
jgi:hypothetical protein